ncbi:MAG: lytic transglycosylase domain-containing protein [Alphaproteobacteria bacterium]|nr:lytic transglycosylase domain-containing protein [Alphaproteobacteria bacterium]
MVVAAEDAVYYRRILAAQARRDFAAADRDLHLITDGLLLGHVWSQRLILLGSRAQPRDLISWLERFADHPDAPQIYAMLRARQPAAAANIPAPDGSAASRDTTPPEEREPSLRSQGRTPAERDAIARLERRVRADIRSGDAIGALGALNRPEAQAVLEVPHATQLRAEVAKLLFVQNRDAEAYVIASEAARRARGEVGFADWVAGLSAWRLGRTAEARAFFEATAMAPSASDALKAAGAFWAARAHLATRNPQYYVPWMLEASQHARTFYGLMARRVLGLPAGFAWQRDQLSAAELTVLAETAPGLRALALLQIGERERATAELILLAPRARSNPALARALVVMATHAQLPSVSARVARAAETADGRPRDAARYPIPPWEPRGGFTVDPALIYALARQESNFEPGAISPAGARGLMQIMPATARYLMGGSMSARDLRLLHDPEFSLELGQRYVRYLSRAEPVQGGLVQLLASYNAGPGNLARWNGSIVHRGDPLLYMESIPNIETRHFVQRVLAFYWIYSSRLGQATPSLDQLARGQFPRFQEGAGEQQIAEMPRAERPERAARTQAAPRPQPARANRPAQRAGQPRATQPRASAPRAATPAAARAMPVPPARPHPAATRANAATPARATAAL